MKTLLDLAEEYNGNIYVVKAKIKELKKRRKENISPDELFRINKRISEWQSVVRTLTEYYVKLKNYYNKGENKYVKHSEFTRQGNKRY